MGTPDPIGIPLGVRLNNPGCVRWDGVTNWQGLAERPVQKGDFLHCISPEWGIRLIARILRSYEERGIHTVSGAITAWSPPNENPTASYIRNVCMECGVNPTTLLMSLVTPNLIKGIIRQECGTQPYSDETIALGISLAEDDT
jgi:hypothetical protein